MRKLFFWVALAALVGVPAVAQQVGSISGTVSSPEGDALPGVTIEASGDVLPRARVAQTDESGNYRLEFLPPGNYEISFSLAGMATQKRSLKVRLQENSVIDIDLAPESVSEEIVVVAAAPSIDTRSAEIKTAIDDEVIDLLPIGQQYRDLVKLIPGVQYTEDSVRGPSAGGSGQDNVYQFDGVNVGRPLFGSLSSEPSSHDIDQIAVIKGGAQAIDFNRSGGFTINSVSKSGTNRYHGEVSYQIQTEGMTGDRDNSSAAEFEEDRDWTVANVGGPISAENLFFYLSYFRPTEGRTNRANLYGAVPDFDSTRNELFGKLTFTPTSSLLVNTSYRDSERENRGESVGGSFDAGSTSEGSDNDLTIATVEGSWVASENSYLTFKYTDFEELNFGRPDNLFTFPIAVDGSVALDVNNLDQQGLFLVPQPLAGEPAFNAFIQPLINRYGFSDGGVPTGGGTVGAGSTINDQDFFRESFQLGYDHVVGKHELHVGYQWYRDEEDLSRLSNGWGLITVPGGRTTTSDGTPIFYEARFEQQSLGTDGVSPVIHSEFESQSFEINDSIRLDNWTINLGVLLSNDQLYGQGLRPNSSNVSGFELAPGNRYLMHEDDFTDMIQPRASVTRSLHGGQGSAYASYARYNPAASSLPRAASWGRNLRRSIRAFFDASGNLISVDPVRSSSGKFFQDDLDPRSIDEFILGYSRQFTPSWNLRAHVRYRYGDNYWEDTNNNARQRFLPPDDIPQDLYIPELDSFRAEVGGSSYVIAQLDGAFTKYYEAGVDAEWRGRNMYARGSYVWSHYYGNFDQDNTTTSNDADTFIGSSFVADGAGRQLWNFREGNLRGDRRHQLKLFGFYNFRWSGSAGAYAIYQSGQPWEAWDVEVYRDLTGSSSDTSRFAEPAGSRTTSAHYQIDLNYTHDFVLRNRYTIQLRGDLYNLFDKQTGYNIQNKRNSAGFGDARSFFNPRRFQLAVKFRF